MQDVISCWAYRREWSAWNLKVLLPGSIVGVGAAWLFASYVPNAYVEIAVGVTGICFVLYIFFARLLFAYRPTEPHKPSAAAGMFWAPSRASPRPSSRWALRPIKFTSFRSGSISSR